MLKEKASLRLFLCLFFVYTMNTFGKIAFPAVTAALINEAVLTKTQAGTVSGVFWLIYAAGQFAGGTAANRYSPTLLIKIGVLGGAAANFLMATLTDYIPILIVWSANGLLQFGLWPSILALMSNAIIPSQRGKAFDYIAYCYGIGSILSHLCTALLLTTLTWRWVFICCGTMGLISVIPVIYAEKRLMPHLKSERKPSAKTEKNPLPKGFVWKSGLLFFCILFFIKSLSETGIKTWMPTILMETYGAHPSYTSLLSVVLLLLNLLGVSAVSHIYRKAKENEVSTLLVLYLFIVPLMLLLLRFRDMNTIITTIIFSLITVSLYGSGQVLSTYYPSRFQLLGGVAFIGGVMNCAAALGNVVAAYLNGLIADLFGWDMIIYMWNAFIIIFVLITIILIPIWKKFRKENNIK